MSEVKEQTTSTRSYPDVVVLTTSVYAKLAEGPDLGPFERCVLTEDELVVRALEKQGLTAQRVAWDEPNFDWLKPKAVVFRSIWDYFYRYGEFSDWLEKVSSQNVYLLNSAETLAWNIDKHYLIDIGERRVNVCKSTFVEIGVLESKKTTLSALIEEELPWDDFVIKPCISGSARETYRVSRGHIPKEVDDRYAKLNKDEAFIVQPFQKNIPLQGEVSLVVLNGVVTHGVLKKASEGDFRVQEEHGGTIHDYQFGQEEKEFAEKCVMACDELPLYARVDMFRDNDDKWSLAELELIEPELWFRKNPQAADIFALGIVQRLRLVEEAKAELQAEGGAETTKDDEEEEVAVAGGQARSD